MARRNLQDWASIAEIVGAFAIVASLVYVGYELRENNRILQVSSRQTLSEQEIRYYESSIDSSVIARAIDKSSRGEQLSGLESSQLIHRQGLNFLIFEHAFFHYQNNALGDRVWDRYRLIIRYRICNDQIAQQMWAEGTALWNSEFVQVVENERQSCSQ